MKILPNNIKTKQDLSFRLRLDVQFNNTDDGSTKTTNGIRIEDSISDSSQGLDIDFEIERTDGTEPSLATITIWNISDNLFNQISSNSNVFELYYAKGKSNWSLLFRGTPYFATQGNNNTSKEFVAKEDSGSEDIATTIALIDSLKAFESATISKSYQGNVSTRVIIEDCANIMGVKIGDEITTYPEINNYVARGKASEVLNEVCGKIGCKHIIENGVLHLFDTTSTKASGYLFNTNNSSRPQLTQEDKIIGHTFTTMLLPNLRAGQKCKCDFDTLSGTKEIFKVRLAGNNYGTLGESEVWVK